jgi:hypothetical protein
MRAINNGLKIASAFLMVSLVLKGFAQSDGSPQLTKYDKDFVFYNGVYLTFEEFKNNSPSIRDFRVVRSSQFSGQITLEYDCRDDKTGAMKSCVVDRCWGYAQNNTVFIAQGMEGYYFRLHIIGALIHYFSVEVYSMPYYDYSYGYPTYRSNRRAENREYIIELETGRRVDFNYKNFSRFLLENDKELYDELQNTKRKRKMIYHFLIRYNQKHPVYFPI